uniref:Uncharacterized protein n=1 Tax=Arundo donax TaxID=35708 RepID=A0A0A9HCG3_ARUDO
MPRGHGCSVGQPAPTFGNSQGISPGRGAPPRLAWRTVT